MQQRTDVAFLMELHQEPTKQGPKSTESLPLEQEKLLNRVMKKVVNYGLLSDPGKVSDWVNGLTDKTPQELAEGVRKAKDHRGPLSLPDFRAMCQVDSAPSYFTAIEHTRTQAQRDSIKKKTSHLAEEMRHASPTFRRKQETEI